MNRAPRWHIRLGLLAMVGAGTVSNAWAGHGGDNLLHGIFLVFFVLPGSILAGIIGGSIGWKGSRRSEPPVAPFKAIFWKALAGSLSFMLVVGILASPGKWHSWVFIESMLAFLCSALLIGGVIGILMYGLFAIGSRSSPGDRNNPR
ncbi:MAG: hypothetical protein ACR2IE_01685 [Candidatus Sumerlaeaceae bacterium]